MLNYIASLKTGIITLFLDGKARTVGEDHPNYTQVKAALKSNDQALLQTLLDAPVILNGAAVFNENGTVTFNGKVLNSNLAKRVAEYSRKGFPVDPLLRFIENCARNPSQSSVEELFDFLENKGIPITEDGCFLCYKAVRSDFMDKYRGVFLNAVGTIVKMDRTEVDPNRDRECSFGLHVGALDYIAYYGTGTDDVWLLVKVNPMHAVAVPRDHNAQKMRVSEYLVLQEIEKTMNSQKTEKCYSPDGMNVIEAPPEPEDTDWDCANPESCNQDMEKDDVADEAMLALEKETEKFMSRHTRDSAVARAAKLGLISSKNIGRDLGKEACCQLLAVHKLNG